MNGLILNVSNLYLDLAAEWERFPFLNRRDLRERDESLAAAIEYADMVGR